MIPITQGMSESSLEKILRLSGDTPGPRKRPTSGLRLGNPFRASWGNVGVGDVVEFGAELWKVIPTSSYPNHGKPGSKKPDTGSMPPASLDDAKNQPPGTGAVPGVQMAGPLMPGAPQVPGPAAGQPPAPQGDPNASGAVDPQTGLPAGHSMSAGQGTQTLYLQDVRHPKEFDELTLPSSYVVTVVPVLP